MSLNRFVQFIVRSVVLVLVWLIVSEADVSSLRAGVPAALVAAAISLAMRPDRLPRVSPSGFARFVGFFLVQSVRGGVDVALRAMRPSLPIDPETVSYPLRIEPVPMRVLFTNVLSLLPGTLSAHLDEHELLVHVLDRHAPVIHDISVVESRVAAVFGVTLAPLDEGSV